MSCQNFEASIIGMARAQLLEASARREALAHIAQCAACADKLAEQQALSAAVRATARSLAVEEASIGVEHALRAAFRSQTAFNVASAPRVPPAQRWQLARRMVFAAAAVLLVVFSAGLIWQRLQADQKPALATTPPRPAPTVPASEILPKHFLTSGSSVSERKPQVALKPRQMRPALRSSQMSEEEMTAGFIALAEEGELAPLESGQVLRVELSASTLISMGLPILAEDVSKPVLADLLLGQDGLARAIRFVKPDVASVAGASQTATNR